MEELVVQNEIGSPETVEAARFVEDKYRTVDWKGLKSYLHWLRGTGDAKEFPGQTRYRIRTRTQGTRWWAVRVFLRPLAYPYRTKAAVGSTTEEEETAQPLCGEKFWYEYDDVILSDEGEFYIVLTCAALTKPLRVVGLEPEKNTKTGMARYALRCLEEFRAWKKKDGGSVDSAHEAAGHR